jgi:signal transduction histidine kinase
MTAPRDRMPLVRRLTTSQWFALAAALLALVTAVGTALGVVAIVRLTEARNTVLDRNGPAVLAQMQLSTALVEQESGLRGYVLTGREEFLEPYRGGRASEREQLARLGELLTGSDMAAVRRTTALVRERVARWRRAYATPVIERVRASGADAEDMPSAGLGRRTFDGVREALALQGAALDRVRVADRTHFKNTASFLSVTFAGIVVLLAIGIVGALLALRVTTTRPLRRLGRGVRRIARGDFDHGIERAGARDVVQLGDDVDSMRQRIVAELSSLREAHEQLDEQARELARSNAELEQFAYVASHDLQEPLRKVASFCQLIEQRYDDQLDERGRQYIAFAVDGAKRMQQLINDLLAFSRVGRGDADHPLVAGDDVLRQALASLAEAIDETGAQIEAGPLPQVRAEPALLAAVFQNLIGNALKFHGDGAPHVWISAERRGAEWLFTCADDGIGIEPDYADRIFMIFQRLHPKDVFTGTGIGLAMCRKIVEYLGGRIWLDTDTTDDRTTFRFTLPAPTIEEPA